MNAMTAIYQRARPATFAEVVGQEHVKDVLTAALERGRAGHAYLFSGPRGVGKTTTARLLAMALNCEAEGDAQRPCGRCDGCRMVREGHHPDVTELDAASNNSVEDVRDLREKTALASMRGGTRVWILDEAHMLSRQAANALLKTLEEPPPGLVFILATTEPEKLPPTVLSRCQHFRFRRLAEPEILGKLERLCTEAGVEAESDALALVARAADGAMRDAESLLERLLTPGRPITLAAAEDALGLPPVHRMQRLASALADAELTTLLSEAEGLYRDGFAPRSLADNLCRVLRDALRNSVLDSGSGFRLQLDQPALMRLIHVLDDEQERFVRRDDLYSLEVALIKAVNALQPSAPPADEAPAERAPSRSALPEFDPTGRVPAGKPAASREGATGGRATGKEAGPRGSGRKESDARVSGNPAATAPRAEAGSSGGAERRAGDTDSGDGGATSGGSGESGKPRRLDWHKVRTAAGPQLKAFLIPARETVDGDEVVIRYAETHKFHYNELKKREDELVRLIEEVGGSGFRLRIEGPGEKSPKKY